MEYFGKAGYATSSFFEQAGYATCFFFERTRGEVRPEGFFSLEKQVSRRVDISFVLARAMLVAKGTSEKSL